ncbi:DUF808 domain-containing protein [Kocuria rhizophila]|uniref:DUF808 domain-containing protein n=1 Tax=Kocuria rhizophila TaxID=72000 RepID=UPI0021A8FA83|nr:DUF808 domain-containing protein [Kocuria rhizophila]MCT1456670.1 DUF808 domain-containing protein [Kocuria rhizophila]MCT1880631.1 DUF808 domain-containing protein [Kocuria rhizophila]
MSAGLAALLDDVAALAKMAAANVDDIAGAAGRASAKAAGVVVDDTAVTPRYVEGISPSRELPIIKKITIGSLRNKLLIILPIALILSEFAPWLLTPLLMLGGTYLCFEGAEAIGEHLFSKGHAEKKPAAEQGPEAEKKITAGAIRTDLILSAEIMVISLNEVANEPLLARTLILIAVAIFITFLVYGVVALIVKMDDIGLAMAKRDSETSQRFGEFLVRAMPSVLNVISIVGMFAMLWVGGHIILVGTAELGFTAPEELVHHLSEAVHHVAVVGPVLAWLVETVCALVLGVIWGAIIVGIVHVLPFGKKHDDDAAPAPEADAQGTAPRQDKGPGTAAAAHGSDLGSPSTGSGSSAAQDPSAGR